MNYSESEKAERRMLIKLREADFFTQRDSLVEQIKSLAPTQFFKDTQKKWEKAIKAKDRVTEEITSSVSLKPLSGKEQFLLAMQVDLLRKEITRLRELYEVSPLPEERMAEEELDPVQREKLNKIAEKKRASLTPEAKVYAMMAELAKSLPNQPKAGSKSLQDQTPDKPRFSEWGKMNLEMSVYDLSEGTGVARKTLQRFLKRKKLKRLRKVGQLSIYGTDTAIAVAREWLSNKRWYRTLDGQKFGLLEFLYQIEKFNSELFPRVVNAFLKISAEVDNRDVDFRSSWLTIVENYKTRQRTYSQWNSLI
ncbi:MAG: hypothetical protein JNN07_27900 [Verrucomicrobiales bacterium]|nr:hypothetical protein [Verrucomicrobiales bacterium]